MPVSPAMLVLTLLSGPARGEESVEVPPVEAQDLDARERPAKWWGYPAAVGNAMLFNTGLHLTTRYVIQADWAYISWGSVTDPDRTAWVFDDNEFLTNAVGHPYQGASYYQGARIHDLTYLEAVPVVVAGSLVWELWLETEPPSINDQVTTSWSGPFVGEVLWRLSSQVLDESVRGRPRLLRELGAAAISPIRGLDRLITGQAWRSGPPTLHAPVHHDLALGVEFIERVDSGVYDGGARLHWELAYGDAFARSDLTRPLDVFDLHLDVADRSLDGGPGVALTMTGALVGRRFDLGDGGDQAFLGLFQGASYVDDRAFALADSSLGPGLWLRTPVAPDWDFETRAYALAVPMGAVDSPYAEAAAGRSYVMGPGGAIGGRLHLHGHRVGDLFAEGRRTWIASVADPVGTEVVGQVRGGATVHLWRRFGLGTEVAWQDRHSSYRDHLDRQAEFLSVMIHATKEL